MSNELLETVEIDIRKTPEGIAAAVYGRLDWDMVREIATAAEFPLWATESVRRQMLATFTADDRRAMATDPAAVGSWMMTRTNAEDVLQRICRAAVGIMEHPAMP